MTRPERHKTTVGEMLYGPDHIDDPSREILRNAIKAALFICLNEQGVRFNGNLDIDEVLYVTDLLMDQLSPAPHDSPFRWIFD